MQLDVDQQTDCGREDNARTVMTEQQQHLCLIEKGAGLSDIDQEIRNLWKRVNLLQAQADAIETVLQAALPFAEESPTFATALQEIVDAQIANRYCRGVDEKYINEYLSSLKTILPQKTLATLKLALK